MAIKYQSFNAHPTIFSIRAAAVALLFLASCNNFAVGAEHGPSADAAEDASKLERERPRNAHGWTAIVDGKPVAAPQIPMGDEVVVRSILDEGIKRNQVMAHLTYLSTTIGPRLTGSSAVERANNWCREQYAAWGLANAHLEQYKEISVRFDRGPSTAKILLRRERKKAPEKAPASASSTAGDASGALGAKREESAAQAGAGAAPEETKPEVTYDTLRECEITTLAWASGTQGDVRGPVVREPQTEEEYAAIKGKLSGAWILLRAPAPIGQRGIRSGMATRYDVRKDARRKQGEGIDPAQMSIPERLTFDSVAGYISTSRDERVWTGAVPGWSTLDFDSIPRDVHIQVRLSDYDYLNSRLSDEDPVEFTANVSTTFIRGPIPLYNTMAEIVGTQWPNEVIIVSAHLDSWDGPGSQGCTDNGTGSAVTLEAARILAAVGARPLRTIRFINWTGEEQGLLGSKGYAEKHPETLAYVSAVFVDDGGTDSQGGLVCADNMADYLAAATAPTNFQFYSSIDQRWLNVNIKRNGLRNPRGGGSDHATFNAAGVPGFFWDEVGRADYGHGWHTQYDTLDLAVPEYLVQSATNTAITAYRLACAPELLSREPAKEPPAEKKSDDVTGAAGANPGGAGAATAPKTSSKPAD